MKCGYRILSLLVFAGLFSGTLKAEIIYSGVKKIPINGVGLSTPVDLDGDGVVDLTFAYVILSTMDIPSSGASGSVSVRAGASTRILTIENRITALPFGYDISSTPDAPYKWVSAKEAPYGFGIAGWSGSLLAGLSDWTGWWGLGAALDPVIGVELSKSGGKHYAWLRLSFDGIEAYDWAYQTVAGTPITARMGAAGFTAIPPQPPGEPGQDSSKLTYEAKLSASKAVPPSANTIAGTAYIRLRQTSLWCELDVNGLDSGTDAILEAESENTPLRFGTFYNAQNSRNILGIAATLTESMAAALRSGGCHLVLKLPGGDIRGQIALKFPDIAQDSSNDAIAGEYSLLIRLPSDMEAKRPLPEGTAHGRLTIIKGGAASLNVSLPIGAPLRWRGKLGNDNTLTVNVSNSNAAVRTSLRGTLALTKDENEYTVSGALNWQKGVNPNRRRYPGTIKLALDVEGSRFRPHALRRGTYQLSFSGGDLPEPVTIAVHATTHQLVTSAYNPVADYTFTLVAPSENPHGVTLNFNPANGTFRGSFRHPATRTRIPFSGRMLSDSDEGEGTFLGRRSTGSVRLFGFLPTKRETLSATVRGESNLSISETDPDVLVLSLKNLQVGFPLDLTSPSVRQNTASLAPATDLSLQSVSIVPLSFGQPPNGIFEFRLQTHLSILSQSLPPAWPEMRFTFQRPPGCQGIRIYHGGGVIELTAP